jgi:uncharacterized OB-fold protein
MGVISVELGNTGTLAYPSRIKLPCTWHVGKTGSRFYKELKDSCRIWGTKCPQCGLVYVPPKSTCPRCFCDIKEWVDVGTEGTLLTYTEVSYTVPGIQPQKPPYFLGIIQLDRASTGFVHMLGEVDISELKTGMRMQAVFREKREGIYLDIRYFRPAKP